MVDNQSGTLQSPSIYSSSSNKTGSSTKSSILVDKVADYTKDNSASPLDLEAHIQTERITKILDEAIIKTKLAICVPNLVHEYKTLSSELSAQHMEDLIFIFDQYDNPLFSASLLNNVAMSDLKSGNVSLNNRLNPELGHLLYIMNSYPSLRPVVEDMIAEDNKPDPGIEYLLALEQFRDLMVKQMNMTAAEELATKIKTRKLETSNAKLVEKINEYTRCLKEEQVQFEATMQEKFEIIDKLEKEIELLNVEANVRLKKKILDTDRQMVLATRSHIVKNEMLKEEEQESKEAYENLLRKNLNEERNHRARRFKVETQLMSWIQKYDLEMAEKQVELDDFTDQHEDELRKIEELENMIAEQDKEYIPLMEERENEYQQEMLEKMTKFQREHAARVLQNAWREVLINRAEKKKLRKLIKKKQDEEAAAELAAKKAEEIQKKNEAQQKKAEAKMNKNKGENKSEKEED